MEHFQKFKTVSVILPVYNGSQFLEKCISSVLHQSYPITEFIIINDGSEDDIVFTLLENVIINEDLRDKIDVDFGRLNGIHKSTFFVKSDSFLKVGYFSSQSGSQEFLNWFALALDLGLSIHTIKEVLVKRTIHGANQTILNREMKNDFPRVLKAIIDRRRSGSK